MSKVSEEIKFKLEDINASWRAKTKKQKAGVIAILLTGGVLVGFGISYATQPSEEEVFKQQQEQVDGLLEELGAYTEEEKEVLSMEAEEGSELDGLKKEIKSHAKERVEETDLEEYRIKDSIVRDGYYFLYDATTNDREYVDKILKIANEGNKVTVISTNIRKDGNIYGELFYALSTNADENSPELDLPKLKGFKVTEYKISKPFYSLTDIK